MSLKHCVLIIGCVIAMGLFAEAEAQQFAEDVVYLKNGSVVRGIIVEQIPNETLKIRTQGGSEFVFEMSDVLKITKELPVVEPPMPDQPLPSRGIKVKDPAIALILSFLLVGGGQYYVEEYNKAYTHWLVAIGGIAFMVKGLEDNYTDGYNNSYDPDDDDSYVLVGILVGLTNWFVSIISAPSQAHAFNEKQRQGQAVSLIDDRFLLESYTSGEAQGAMLSLRF